MSDRRNLIGAASIAVLALGVGALLSLAVVREGQSKPYPWSSPAAVASLGVVIVGLLAFSGVLCALAIVDRKRRQIDRLVMCGQFVLDEIHRSQAATSSMSHAEIMKHCNDWGMVTTAWMRKHLPYYEGHFSNQADARPADEVAVNMQALGLLPDVGVELRGYEERLRAQLLRLKEITGWL